MSDNIAIGLLATSTTVFGWLIAYYFTRKREDRTRRIENCMKRYECQVREFYGPIYSLINQLHNYNRIQHLIVGTEINKQLTEEEISQTYSYFTVTYFLPLHHEINEIIKNKFHLISDTKIPKSFDTYLRHATQLLAQKGLWEDRGVESSHLRGVDFPDMFFDDIKQGLNSALKNYERCLTSLDVER